MTRSYSKCFLSAALVAVSALLIGAPCLSLTLISPTPDQAVRENVKIVIPASALPSEFFLGGQERPFIGILVGQPGSEEFVEAVSAGSVTKSGDSIIIYWNSKAPYHDNRDTSNTRVDKYFKDGSYSLKVELYSQTTNSSKVIGSAAVNIVLKNKVDRTNPAPAVSLANSLPFGQESTYRVRTGLQLFDPVGLPILGGVGLTGDFVVVQTVEDVRKSGELMLRMRLNNKANMSIFGERKWLYQGMTLLPQLYRLTNKYGAVFNANMFKKQAQYSITDILPVLPNRPVKEGDTWPDSMNLKVEGITSMLRLSGTCGLDSFEWHNNKECAKLVSRMTTDGQISFNGNKIRSGGRIDATVTTYFAYKTGRMITRVIDLDFPVAIEQGADQNAAAAGAQAPAPTQPTGPYDESGSDGNGWSASPGGTPRGGADQAGAAAAATPTQRGRALMTVTIQLEK